MLKNPLSAVILQVKVALPGKLPLYTPCRHLRAFLQIVCFVVRSVEIAGDSSPGAFLKWKWVFWLKQLVMRNSHHPARRCCLICARCSQSSAIACAPWSQSQRWVGETEIPSVVVGSFWLWGLPGVCSPRKKLLLCIVTAVRPKACVWLGPQPYIWPVDLVEVIHGHVTCQNILSTMSNSICYVVAEPRKLHILVLSG